MILWDIVKSVVFLFMKLHLPSQQIIGLKDIANTAYQPCSKPLVFFTLIFAKGYKVTLDMIEGHIIC
jgi:hypothetical protein